MGVGFCGLLCSGPSEKEAASPERKEVGKKVATLKELIISSPGFNNTNIVDVDVDVDIDDNDDEYYGNMMHKQASSSSRKIHPSLCGSCSCEGETKPKKKVRFRSPEIADIIRYKAGTETTL